MSQLTADSTKPDSVLQHASSSTQRTRSLQQQAMTVLFSLLALAALCWLDISTPPQVHFGLLYLLPVLIAAWFGGRWPGYVLTVAASVGWLWAGRPVTDGPSIWVNGTNLFIRGTYYILMVQLLVMLRDFGRRLEESVQDRTVQLRTEVQERQRAEEALRKLAAQLSAAEDVERRRIAYDIHDSLSQMLGVVKMNLETIVAETAIDSRPFERLHDVVKIVEDLIRQTREMTFDLHPSMLDHFGLVPTLQKFAEDFQRRTISEVTITEFGDRLNLTTTLASYLFRAIKEVVNNAVKHGNAKEIIVAIHWEISQLRCVVDDDGGGFDPVKALAPHAGRGLGLAGMDERLTSLGGKLHMESQLGNGARLILEVPVTKKLVTAQ